VSEREGWHEILALTLWSEVSLIALGMHRLETGIAPFAYLMLFSLGKYKSIPHELAKKPCPFEWLFKIIYFGNKDLTERLR
jgi:hypothetical protein